MLDLRPRHLHNLPPLYCRPLHYSEDLLVWRQGPLPCPGDLGWPVACFGQSQSPRALHAPALTLPPARERAQASGLKGEKTPWRSASAEATVGQPEHGRPASWRQTRVCSDPRTAWLTQTRVGVIHGCWFLIEVQLFTRYELLLHSKVIQIYIYISFYIYKYI